MARSYIVSPTGRGAAYTQAKPGPLSAAISKAKPGDEIVLKDGVYRQFVRFKRGGTQGNPITLRSETPQKAVIILPDGVREGKFTGKNSVINTTPYGYITIRALTIDGMQGGEGGITSDSASNIVIEYNHIRNTGSVGIGMKGLKDSVVRFNLIEDTGCSFLGEGLYVGQAEGRAPVLNVEIYGNIVRRARMNFIDMKRGNQNVNVHHNVLEDLVKGRNRPDLGAGFASDGLVIMGASTRNGSRFENNIIRNVARDKPAQVLKISQHSRHLAQNNAVCNISENERVISGHQDGETDNSVITCNVFSNLKSYLVNSEAGQIGGIDISDNKMDAIQEEYEAEEHRILKELLSLEGATCAPWIKELEVKENECEDDKKVQSNIELILEAIEAVKEEIEDQDYDGAYRILSTISEMVKKI